MSTSAGLTAQPTYAFFCSLGEVKRNPGDRSLIFYLKSELRRHSTLATLTIRPN